MAEKEKIIIDIFRNKTADEYTRALADPNAKVDTGSGAAWIAAVSAAFMCRAAGLAAKTVEGNERLDYIARNAEIIRGYMVQLIDEDVKCRGPLRMALRENDERRIEATRQTAVSICAEIINMMSQALELMQELTEICSAGDAMPYLAEAAVSALGAIRAARLYIVAMADKSPDDTYRYVIRRENEITLERCEELAAGISAKAEAGI